MIRLRSMLAAACLVLSACTTSSGAPHVFPEFSYDDSDAAVVVGWVSPGKYMPELEECTKPDVICLHSPFWFRLRVVDSVYGGSIGTHLKVSTLSHYGMDGYVRPKRPWLISLAKHGSDVVMPLYASDELHRRNDGKLFLLLRSPDPIYWLPCSATQLREIIRAADFPDSELTPADTYLVKTEQASYVIGKRGAFPKYGISLDALRKYLESARPSAVQMHCEQPD